MLIEFLFKNYFNILTKSYKGLTKLFNRTACVHIVSWCSKFSVSVFPPKVAAEKRQQSDPSSSPPKCPPPPPPARSSSMTPTSSSNPSPCPPPPPPPPDTEPFKEDSSDSDPIVGSPGIPTPDYDSSPRSSPVSSRRTASDERPSARSERPFKKIKYNLCPISFLTFHVTYKLFQMFYDKQSFTYLV